MLVLQEAHFLKPILLNVNNVLSSVKNALLTLLRIFKFVLNVDKESFLTKILPAFNALLITVKNADLSL